MFLILPVCGGLLSRNRPTTYGLLKIYCAEIKLKRFLTISTLTSTTTHVIPMNKYLLSFLFYSFLNVANAQIIPGTTLSMNMEAAAITANGTQINMYRVPVTDVTTGATTYWDAAFVFTLLSDGSLSFSRTASAAQSTTQLLN